MCFCGHSADWKREEVPDHKFDFIDVRDYRSTTLLTRLRYGLLWALVIKSFAVYVADIYTAVTLLAIGHFRSSIYQTCDSAPGGNNFYVSIDYSKWIFCGCILFSFLLLAYEAHKARAIVRSRDISYAYTNVMANNYYSLRSYNHFCLFCQINNSHKKKDEFSFFIFFTFKGWKRLVVADGPRQTIIALTLYNFAKCKNFSTNFSDYYEGSWLTAALLVTMLFTVLVFAASLILLLIACIMYIPMLCYIKGNLKEYCCHKIDKRISELVRYKKKQRLLKQAAIARREAEGDFSHLMNKKGEMVGRALPQPTLPKFDASLLKDDLKTAGSVAGAGAGINRANGAGSALGHRGPARKNSVSSLAVPDGAPGLPPGLAAGMGYADSPGFAPGAFYAAAGAGGMTPPGSVLGHDFYAAGADANASSAGLIANAGWAGGAGGAGHGGADWAPVPPPPPSTAGALSPDVMPMRMQGRGGSAGYASSLTRDTSSASGGTAAYPPRAGSSAAYSSAQSSAHGGWPGHAGSRSGSLSGHGQGRAAAAAQPMAPAPTMMTDVGLDYPPPPHAQATGMQGLEYPPPPQPQLGGQADRGAREKFVPDWQPPAASYAQAPVVASPPLSQDPFAEEPRAGHYAMQERAHTPQALYAPAPTTADEEQESSFFAQLNGTAAAPALALERQHSYQQQQQQSLPSAAQARQGNGNGSGYALDPGVHLRVGGGHSDGGHGLPQGSGSVSPASNNSRLPSMNFEDIYAQYDGPPDEQHLHHSSSIARDRDPRHESVLDAYFDR